MKSYTELGVWIEARNLVNSVYEVTKNFPKEEAFGLTSQIRRSSISIPSNIAEGCGRNSTKETIHFLFIARGSLYELETQLYLSNDQKYITEEELNKIQEQVVTSKKLLNGFINYYKKNK
ncbi:MAG: four helix bundle protein [Bacteroidota bacterium]